MASSKQQPKAVLFSQGDEVINGTIVDTNTAWLAAKCFEMGFDVIQHVTVPDDFSALVKTLEDIDNTADMCICTGGLGPTKDDLTAEAYATAFAKPLQFNAEALDEVQAFFTKLNVEMSEVNRKQAYLPTGTDKIRNEWGTAPGFVGQAKRCRFYFLPGVPYEMKNMLEHSVQADLQSNFSFSSPTLITLRVVGMGESDIQQKVDQVALPKEVRVGFRAGLAENELKLVFPHGFAEELLESYVQEVRRVLGDCVYAVDGLEGSAKTLVEHIGKLMQTKRLSLSLIETVSQGEMARQCDPSWLDQAVVLPNLSYKQESIEVFAKERLSQLLNETGSDVAILQLKEEQGEQQKVHSFLATEDGMSHNARQLFGRTERQQVVAASAAFNLLRKHLQA